MDINRGREREREREREIEREIPRFALLKIQKAVFSISMELLSDSCLV